IVDVARRLAATSPRPISIEFTGLRSGEKMHEALLGKDEDEARPAHPKISHVAVPILDLRAVGGLPTEHATAADLARIAGLPASAPMPSA
ncbi:MAG: polysaccharide biosynthesis protein, partial [Actinobacteria bacterium]|nr:polysaccharide biosynthesis protein [Actinomycetota bacterium]